MFKIPVDVEILIGDDFWIWVFVCFILILGPNTIKDSPAVKRIAELIEKLRGMSNEQIEDFLKTLDEKLLYLLLQYVSDVRLWRLVKAELFSREKHRERWKKSKRPWKIG